MLRVITLLALAVVLIAPTVAQESPAAGESPKAVGESSVIESGRRLTEQFYQGKLEDIHLAFSTEMKTEFPLERLAAVRDQVFDHLGPEIEVHDEQVREKNDYTVYRGLVSFEKRRSGKFEVLWTFRSDDLVAGFFIRDASAGQSE